MAGEITLKLVDSATREPAVPLGTETTLEMQLVNRTGADVALAAGSRPATFVVYLPVPRFFTSEQLSQMVLAAEGWSASVDPPEGTLTTVCTQAGTWARDATLTFTIGRVRSDGPPGTDTVVVGPLNMAGVQFSVDAPLAVSNPPKPGNLKLPEVLQVSLDSQGSIYRSEASDPLTNKLFLTLKNTGATALATDKQQLHGSPQVSVSFVYGNTSGALAPDKRERTPPRGSAWAIKVAPGPSQTAWETSNPRIDGQDEHPHWLMAPVPTNVEILGPADSDRANVTFAFSDIVSLTPAGHTQMLVLFTGFAKDAQTAYDDHLYVLDVVKQDPPPTRGLLSFFSPDPVVEVLDPKQHVTVPLRWSMFEVAHVRLLTSSPAIAPQTADYPEPQPLAYGEMTVELPLQRASEAVFMTLQAFDGRWGYLNSLQFTTYVQVAYVEDPSGHLYRIALIGETFWLTENYQYAPKEGSYAYGDDAKHVPTYGRLYDAATAQASAPAGWRLPDLDDWKALIARFEGAEQAYAALIAGGRSGFDARLGGRRTRNPDGTHRYDDLYGYGFYWLSDGRRYAQFSGTSKRVTAGTPAPDGAALSVRYVRHV